MRAVRIARLPITHPDARQLVEAVQEEYVARYGGRDESPVDPRDFEDPLGQFLVGYLDDVPVATGAWRRSSVTALGADVDDDPTTGRVVFDWSGLEPLTDVGGYQLELWAGNNDRLLRSRRLAFWVEPSIGP